MSSWRPRALTPFRRLRRKAEAQQAEPPAPELSMESRNVPAIAPVEDSLIDAAIYRDGRRIESPPTLTATYERLRALPDTMAWLGLYRPTAAQILAAGEQFGLHELAVEDAIVAHQRPKLERYDDTLFVVLR